jgi:transcription elongation GreA/GreB family factor
MTEEEALAIKTVLYDACLNYVQERIGNAKDAMESAQESANDETKSSAGDKHETGRAMAQLEKEKSAAQLAEASQLKRAFSEFSADRVYTVAGLGSLVIASTGNYYVSISAGKVEVDGVLYFALSPVSPIGRCFQGKGAGEMVTFNGRSIEIKGVY